MLAAPVRYKEPYLGAPPEGGTGLDLRLWGALAQGLPTEVAVVPIMLFDEPICVLYAQGEAGEPGPGRVRAHRAHGQACRQRVQAADRSRPALIAVLAAAPDPA